jgi:hypothetical protein
MRVRGRGPPYAGGGGGGGGGEGGGNRQLDASRAPISAQLPDMGLPPLHPTPRHPSPPLQQPHTILIISASAFFPHYATDSTFLGKLWQFIPTSNPASHRRRFSEYQQVAIDPHLRRPCQDT